MRRALSIVGVLVLLTANVFGQTLVQSQSTAVPSTILTNGLTYSSGTALPATCTSTFPATNGSFFYRTDLGSYWFCHGANSWESVSLPNPGLIQLGGSASILGPIGIGNESLAGGYGNDTMSSLTIRQTDTGNSGNWIGISNEKTIAPASNPGAWSAIQSDNLSYIVGTGTPMTIPFYTGAAYDIETLGTALTIGQLTGLNVKTPTMGANTANLAYGLLIGNFKSGVGGLVTGYSIKTGTGQVNFGDQVTATQYATATNCAVNSVSPAACGSAASGAVVVPTTTTAYTVNTTAVTAASRIVVTAMTFAGNLPSSPTCVTPAVTAAPSISAISAGTSFTMALPSTTGQSCWQYTIED